MFDYSLLHWTTFFGAAVLLNLSPGPDIAFILGRTAQGGRRAGFAAMFGISAGAFGHVLMAALGLSAVLVASATAFTAVKWIGAAYLIWLGVQALRSGGRRFVSGAAGGPPPRPGAVFRQGILIALLNPKVAVFFLAFLPQFVVPGAGPVPAQLLLHGMLIIAVAALVEPLLVVLAHRLMAGLRDNPTFGRWMDRTLGVLLVALGLKLALSGEAR